jgi:hypothetical protein
MPEDPSDASRVRTGERGSWVELFPFALFGVTLLATIVAIVLT